MAPSVYVYFYGAILQRLRACITLYVKFPFQKLVSTLVLRFEVYFNAQQTMRNSKIIIIYMTIYRIPMYVCVCVCVAHSMPRSKGGK